MAWGTLCAMPTDQTRLTGPWGLWPREPDGTIQEFIDFYQWEMEDRRKSLEKLFSLPPQPHVLFWEEAVHVVFLRMMWEKEQPTMFVMKLWPHGQCTPHLLFLPRLSILLLSWFSVLHSQVLAGKLLPKSLFLMKPGLSHLPCRPRLDWPPLCSQNTVGTSLSLSTQYRDHIFICVLLLLDYIPLEGRDHCVLIFESLAPSTVPGIN